MTHFVREFTGEIHVGQTPVLGRSKGERSFVKCSQPNAISRIEIGLGPRGSRATNKLPYLTFPLRSHNETDT